MEELLRNIAVNESDCKISFHSISKDFTDTDRYLILNSRVQYSAPDFNYDAVLPTVRIPYADPSMGFLINGVVSSSIGIYQRSPGVILDVEQKESGGRTVEIPKVDIVSAYNSRISIGYHQNAVVITFRRDGRETKIPIGIFLKTFELPYQELLDMIEVLPPELQNSFLCEVPDKRMDYSRAQIYLGPGDKEPSVDDCIDKVYNAISTYNSFSGEKIYYAPNWKRERIMRYLNSLQFKNIENIEASLSLAARAIGNEVQFDQSIDVFTEETNSSGFTFVKPAKFTLSAGEYIDETLAAELRKYDVNKLAVKNGSKRFILQEYPVVFRAKGYLLATDYDELGLSEGTLITDNVLETLNNSNLKYIEVTTPRGNKRLYRSGTDVTVGDFITILNYLFTADRETISSTLSYDIANRVILSYDKQVQHSVVQAYNDIASAISGCATLQQLIDSLPRLPFNRLTAMIKDPSRKENTQSEISNVLSAAIARGRASALLPEAPKDMAQIQKGQYGRLDSLHAPESEKIGSVQQMTVLARIKPESGEIETPYEVVENGVPTGRIEMVTAVKEAGKYIVAWDNPLEDDYVLARCDGDVTSVRKEQISYRDASPFQDMSVSRATIPFPEFSQPKRALMAAKMSGQAVPLLYPERATVSTGADTEVPCLYYTARQIINAAGIEVCEGEPLKVLDSHWSVIVTYKMVHNNVLFDFTVPCIPTSKDTLYAYNLNVQPDNTYGLDDVVLYSNSCDISSKDFWVRENQGALKFVEDYKRPALAIGVNLRVGYKTYASSTIEDAVVISDELVRNRTLSNIQIIRYEYTLGAQEAFSMAQIPRMHSFVYEGDPVITFTRERNKVVKSYHQRCKQSGEVVFVSNTGQKLSIWVATIHDATVGDKVAGRYGNKSVIARIVPKDQMPYDPITGETLQIICSPLGIPSRMNLGQILEMTLGAAMGVRGQTAVVTPFYKGIKDDIKEVYSSEGLQPKKLFLPEYGKMSERPIMTGILYFMKLEQMSNLKWAAVGYPTATDPIFSQPIKSLNTKKGQSIAEQETWALIAAGAKKQLNNYFTISADDSASRERVFEMLDKNSPEDEWDDAIESVTTHNPTNISAVSLQAVLRTSSLDLEVQKDGKFHVVPLDMDDIPTEITIDTLKSHNELVSPKEWTKIRLKQTCINPYWVNNFPLSFLLNTESIRQIINHKKYVSIATHEVVNAGDVPNINRKAYITGVDAVVFLIKHTSIDTCIARLRSNNISDQNVIQFDSDLSFEELSDLADASIDNIDLLSFCHRLKAAGKDLSILLMNYLPVLPGVFRQADSAGARARENEFQNHTVRIAECSTSDEIYQALEKYIGYGDSSGNSIRKYFFGRGASTGQHGRMREKIMAKKIGFSGRTVIVPMEDPTISPMFVGLPWRAVLVEMSKLLAIRARNSMDEIASELKAKHCAENKIADLVNLEQRDLEKLILTLGEFSVHRMSDYLNANRDFLYNVFVQLRKVIKRVVEGNVRDDGAVKYNGEWVYPEDLPSDATIDAFIVSFGRQPTLHKKSLRTYFVKLVEGYSTHIHPVVCGEYNADFDGDQMWHAQLFGEAKLESVKTTSILQDLISEKDGSYTLSMSQDIALGLYCATTFKDNRGTFEYDSNRGVFCYNSADKLQFDLTYGDLHHYDLVLFTTESGDCYFSTAGRILVNARLPQGLTARPYTDSNGIYAKVYGDAPIPEFLRALRYDCIWCITGTKSDAHGETVQVSDILLETYNGYGARASVMTAQALYEIGLTASDLYSVSFGIDDLGIDFDFKPMLDEPKQLVNELYSLYQLGLITDDERKRSSVRIWTATKKEVQDVVLGELKPSSNMFYMLYSGARGKKDQWMQAAGFIGNISKTGEQDIEYPILSGYGNGLSSFDLMQTCYSARIGVISTQSGTKDTGYATRQSVYMMGGLEVNEDDCGIETNTFQVTYTSGYSADMREKLLGDFIVETSDEFETLKPILSRTGFMITDEVIDRIQELGIAEVTTLNGKVSLQRVISDSCRTQLESMYSYALPYVDEVGRITDKTIHWIESQGLTEVVATDNKDFMKELKYTPTAYMPVEYSSLDRHYYYLDGREIDEELLFSKEISAESAGFHYYKNLLSEDKHLTIAALNYIVGRFLRNIKYTDGTEVRIAYDLSKLFIKLVKGRIAYGLPHLDDYHAITDKTLDAIFELQLNYIGVRTTLTCTSENGCCSKCYGLNIFSGRMADVGTNLGIAAAQTMCEPLSQATMNVQHAGGQRTGLSSGLEYFSGLLKGTLVSQRTRSQLESYAPVSGYVMQSKVNPAFIQIVNENGDTEYSVLLDRAERLAVPNGAYIDEGDVLVTGLTYLDRYRGTDIPDAALKTRYLLLSEYDKVFSSLSVSARNYEILARAQTSCCYLVKPSAQPKVKDTGLESVENTGLYELRVSTQMETVLKYSGIACLAFERSHSVFTMLALDREGVSYGSVLGNLVTGNPTESHYPAFIPKAPKSTAMGTQSATSKIKSILADYQHSKRDLSDLAELKTAPTMIGSSKSANDLMMLLSSDVGSDVIDSGLLVSEGNPEVDKLKAMLLEPEKMLGNGFNDNSEMGKLLIGAGDEDKSPMNGDGWGDDFYGSTDDTIVIDDIEVIDSDNTEDDSALLDEEPETNSESVADTIRNENDIQTNSGGRVSHLDLF